MKKMTTRELVEDNSRALIELTKEVCGIEERMLFLEQEVF